MCTNIMIIHLQESLVYVRDAEDYVDLSDLTWVPTLSYGRKRQTDDSRFLLFPSLVGAAQCGPVSEPGEVIGPVRYVIMCR